ncbi:hypothetical protein BBJ28_00013166 [Nothophytophthora sp. Chile5]|nr:hypothetical protein BBJ28_00013166 [Nothophytophthora sp. Chile5]
MEETQALDEDGQQPKEEEPTSTDEDNKGAFDADVFASMMQQELIAYNVSWDPLMKVLQALGASMAKQQQTQKSNQDTVGEVQDQVNALQGELTSVKDAKQEMATAMEKMQGQMEDLQGQLEQMQALQPQHELEQQQQEAEGHEETPGEESTRANDPPSSASKQVARSNSIGRQPFVTAKELADVKKELSKELKKALAHAFGHPIDEGDEAGDEDSSNATPSAQGENAAEVDGGKGGTEAVLDSEGTPRSVGDLGMAGGFQPPGAPFASDAKLQEELAKLHELQEALNAKMVEHDQRLDALQGSAGNLDELASQLANTGSSSSSTKSPSVINGSSGNSGDNGSKSDGLNSASETPLGKDGEPAVNTTALLRDLKELKALQEMHDQKLKGHDDAMEKHAAEIKTLTDSLDDLNVQQQMAASMYAPSSSRGGEEGAQSGKSGKDGSGESDATSPATSEGVGKASKQGKSSERGSEATSQPQLDLSLVFTKLADLRRSTDASLNTLQQNIKGVSGTTQSQQEQLDALRNSLVFNEHLQIHLVESRLAMQKELLARNQTFQDRTKPQLAEWRKALELNEDKLLQGTCDDETMRALQQLQRSYHRTVLSIAPLVNSPLSIAETMQTLSDEVKQLQNAVQVGVVPLRISDGSSSGDGGDGEPNKDEREEEYTRKLRYLDEEIDATLQVNIMTEKKNDPLIKALDAMREKLESLWSMWHRNYNDQRSSGSGATSVREDSGGNGSNSFTSGSGSHEERRQTMQQSNPEELRELELRLMGAVRRLGMVEEDIERLNSVTAALNPTEVSSHAAGTGASGSGTTAITGRRAPSTNNLKAESAMEELDKLRQEMYAEIASIKALLPGGNGGSSGLSYLSNTTSLVPLDRRSMVEAAAKQGDVLTDLYSQMTGRELDTRLYNTPEGQKQFFDNFLKEVTKKVSHAMLNSDKATGGHRGPSGPGVGGATNANVNYRVLLDNFAQKVDDRLEDARELTAEEMARLRKELMDQLKLRFEVALRDLRGELMLFAPTDGDSTAMGTKPVMCVACSRPVPVSGVIREVGSLPPGDLVSPEAVNPVQTTDYVRFFLACGCCVLKQLDTGGVDLTTMRLACAGQEYDRADDDFVFRAGFKMPATDRYEVGVTAWIRLDGGADLSAC